MEGLIKRLFKRLPENLLKFQEAYVLWNILQQGKDISYREFAYGLEEWETDGESQHNWAELLNTERDNVKRDFRVRKYLIKPDILWIHIHRLLPVFIMTRQRMPA